MTKPGYINAAIRSSKHNEAYLFINDKYVHLDYAPGRTDDRILYRSAHVRNGFKSLAGTIFGSNGIDCAFETDNNEAYIFYQNFCARIDYSPGSDNDRLISGPENIANMFPSLKGTVLENGIDSAYRSTRANEVYLFKGVKHTRIDYRSKNMIGSIRNIASGFTCFRDTIFENGIDAAFASHITNEVYFFKEEHYARVKVTPGESNDKIMGGVKPIAGNWNALGRIIPLYS